MGHFLTKSSEAKFSFATFLYAFQKIHFLKLTFKLTVWDKIGEMFKANLKIMKCNVCGVRTHVFKLPLRLSEHLVDITCLTETHLSPAKKNLSLTIYCHDRADGKDTIIVQFPSTMRILWAVLLVTLRDLSGWLLGTTEPGLSTPPKLTAFLGQTTTSKRSLQAITTPTELQAH